MARNYEKNFGKLNRLWLDKGNVKREKRPKLSSLKTSEEISQWLPSIKSELDFYLKQSEVPCYTEQKIAECHKHINYLEAEYKAFVRKLHQVNTQLNATPWTARPYEKKLKGSRDHLSLHPIGAQSLATSINTLPVLMHDHLYQEDTSMKDSTQGPQIHVSCNSDAPLFDLDTSGENVGPRGNKGVASASLVQDQLFCSEACDEKPKNVLGLNYSSSDDET